MPEELLDVVHVGAAGQEVRRAGVSEGMHGRAVRDPRRTGVLSHEEVERGWVKPPPLAREEECHLPRVADQFGARLA